MSMERQQVLKRLNVVISGRVQGVGFRHHVVTNAERLELTGWVKNRPDGRVEAEFQGEDTAVEQMVDICRQGPPGAWVSDIETTNMPLSEEEESFRVTG